MTAWRIDIKQTIKNEDKSFTEYVETLEKAMYTVKRFTDTPINDDRQIWEIDITRIHIVTGCNPPQYQ